MMSGRSRAIRLWGGTTILGLLLGPCIAGVQAAAPQSLSGGAAQNELASIERRVRFGRDYARCIRDLEALRLRQREKDFETEVLYACAVSSRTAALSNLLRQYPKGDAPTIERWTRDDKRTAVRLSREQVAEQAREMAAHALTLWEAVVPLSRGPDEEAHTLYQRGWARMLLAQYADVLPEPAVRQIDRAINDFRRATELKPEQALYWQALGDAYWGIDGKPQQPAVALEAYEQALKREASRWPIALRLSQLRAKNDYESAIQDFQTVPRRNAGNAYSWYRLAAFQFNAGKGKQALDSVERGNRCTQYRMLTYPHGIDPLLAVPWSYDVRIALGLDDAFYGDFIISIVGDIGKRGGEQIRVSDFVQAERGARALLGIALKISGYTGDSRPTSSSAKRLNMSLADIVADRGYALLQDVYKYTGSDDLREAIAWEQQEFKTWLQQRIQQ